MRKIILHSHQFHSHSNSTPINSRSPFDMGEKNCETLFQTTRLLILAKFAYKPVYSHPSLFLVSLNLYHLHPSIIRSPTSLVSALAPFLLPSYLFRTNPTYLIINLTFQSQCNMGTVNITIKPQYINTYHF